METRKPWQQMTVAEAARLVLGEQTFDTALPQQWLDGCVDALAAHGDERPKHVIYRGILANFVWAYDRQAPVFGRPCALTHAGNGLLIAINAVTGTCWPLTENPVDE